jgi:hypothetical protein
VAETRYWESLEESEQRSFNEEATAMKGLICLCVFIQYMVLTGYSDGLIIIHNIYTALNKIMATDQVAGGLQIYVKMAFHKGADLKVSSFQCGKHGNSGHPGFEKFAPGEIEALHTKWKAYCATVLKGNL